MINKITSENHEEKNHDHLDVACDSNDPISICVVSSEKNIEIENLHRKTKDDTSLKLKAYNYLLLANLNQEVSHSNK